MDLSKGSRERIEAHKERMLAAVEMAEVRDINAHLPFADPIDQNVTIAGVEVPIRRDTYRQADARARFERRRQRLINRLKF